MNIEDYTHTTISLFGKPRAFSEDALKAILASYSIDLVFGYDEKAALIVEGALIPTPLRIKAEELYEKGFDNFVDIESFERAAAKAIEPKKLLMHLKLAADQEKIVAYLQNDYIDDELFLQLLRLYDFGNENFFENDTSRDVTAALIRRFYKEYVNNHNIQYSYIGLLNALEASEDVKLIETLFFLAPVQKALTKPNDPNAKLLQMIAIHPKTPKRILETIAQKGYEQLLMLLASRTHQNSQLQETLLEKKSSTIDALLAKTAELSPSAIETLLQRGFETTLAEHLALNDELFEQFRHIPQIGKNPSLTESMQKALLKEKEVGVFLASNPACKVTKELLKTGSQKVQKELYRHQNIFDDSFETKGFEAEIAANPFAPKAVLEEIYTKGIDAANKALASNPATPIEILYQLSFDMRYAKDVKQNPSFGEHIKTSHAIGVTV